MDISVTIGGKTQKNPVGVASGTFGYGSEYENLMEVGSLGALYTKAVTMAPRMGNDIPRLVETPAGMLNSIGLANVGVEKFVETKLPYLGSLNTAVIVNVAGSVEDDYIQLVERIDQYDEIWGYEINISCPNVKCGGMALGTDPKLVEKLTGQLRKLTKKPLIMKLTPNVTDIASIALAAEAGGADAVSCINTLVGMAVDIRKKKPVLPAKTAGLSGPAIKPAGIAAVYRVRQAVKLPIVGLGGIMNTNDAIEYLLVGANAIQVGTATFVDPHIPGKIITGIQEYMKENGLSKIEDFHQFYKEW